MTDLTSKEKIISASRKLFSEKGFDAASIDDIAKEAGTTKSLFYYYFESKKDILYSLMETCLEDVIRKLALNRKNGISSKTKEEFYVRCRQEIKQQKDIFKIALAEILKGNLSSNIICELPTKIFEEFDDIFTFSPEERVEIILMTINIIAFDTLKENMAKATSLKTEELEKIFLNNLAWR
jgi:AcrR family transcriptional regulator